MKDNEYKLGQIVWADYTSEHADSLKEFYKEVAGWKEHPIKMQDENGEYHDYAMLREENEVAGGICYKRGVNSAIPS